MAHNILHTGIAVLIMAVSSSSAIAKPETVPTNVTKNPSASDRMKIAKILQDQDSAWATGDADGYTSRVLPEVGFTNVMGAYSIGKDPLLAQVRKIFSTIYKGSQSKTTLVHITLIDNNVAIVDTISRLRGFAHPAIESVVIDGATYSRLQETMVKRNGAWWIASIHNVFIEPAFADKTTLPQ